MSVMDEVIELSSLDADPDDLGEDAPLSALSAFYCDDAFFG
jgi:hypothetical protein